MRSMKKLVIFNTMISVNTTVMANIPQHFCLIYAMENPIIGISAHASNAGSIQSIVFKLRSKSTSMKKINATIPNGNMSQVSFLSVDLSNCFIATLLLIFYTAIIVCGSSSNITNSYHSNYWPASKNHSCKHINTC